MEQKKEIVFEPFRKYLLPERGIISIDRGKGGAVAVLARGRSGWQLTCEDQTAQVLLNGEAVRGGTLLKSADEICIGWLRMVLLNGILAVEEGEGTIQVRGCLQRLYVPEDLEDFIRQKQSKEGKATVTAAPQAQSKALIAPQAGITLPTAPQSGAAASSSEASQAGAVSASQIRIPQAGTAPAPGFTPMPRIFHPVDETPIVIEGPPAPTQMETQPLYLAIGPSLTMMFPMSLGLCMSMLGGMAGNGIFAYTGLATAAGSAFAGAFWAWARLRYEKRRRAARENARSEQYGLYLKEQEEKLHRRQDDTKRILLSRYRDPSELCAANVADPAMWSRSWAWPDFLWHRLGIGSIPLPAPVRTPEVHFRVERDLLADKPGILAEKYRMLDAVPDGLDFYKHRLVGVVYEDSSEAAGLIRILAAQIAACNPPEHVRIALLMDEGNLWERELLDCLKWLPHVRTGEGRGRYLAGTKAQRSDLCYALTEICRGYLAGDGNGEKEQAAPVHYIIIVSDPGFLLSEPLGAYLQRKDMRCPVTALILARHLEGLPPACRIVLYPDARYPGRGIFYTETAQLRPIRFDRISSPTLEHFARRLAPIPLANSGSAGIPARISFLAMYGVRHPGALRIEKRWQQARTDESLRVPVGVRGGGALCYLDIHEKYHGPHGLVAGTTGSGKSEVLLTWLLSLAVCYAPSDVSFFIIDYKGGGMGGMLEGLPHLAGQISNLSGSLIDRAFVSIESENRRRQKLLRRFGVSRIGEYTRLVRSGQATEAMPHLLIVVDEFAELRREKPEAMQRLISVAQIGRSLGVHLILSTQRPGGVVDENIKSNARFRLCLRVQSKQDSMEMLGRPDAAGITVPGRGYLQVGGDELFEAFQSGYCGARYVKNSRPDPDHIARLIALDGTPVSLQIKEAADEPAPRAYADDQKETELNAVIAAVKACAQSVHAGSAGSLWLPPLPRVLESESLADSLRTEETNQECVQAVIGLLDDPAGQRQMPLILPMPACGHIAVMGVVQSGKSTLLKTLACSVILSALARHLTVWIYGIDCSGGGLLDLEKAPCVGGVVTEQDEGRMRRLLLMLDKMLSQRRQKEKEEAASLPLVLILLDHYSTFAQATGDAYAGIVSRILTHGPAVRMLMVISAAGFGAGQIPAAERKNIRTVLCLEMEDAYRCAELLGGRRPQVMPPGGIPGRGLALWENEILEFQTALPPQQIAESAPAAGTQATAESASAPAAGTRSLAQSAPSDRACNMPEPPAIPCIPNPAILTDFMKNEAVRNMLLTGEGIPIGYDIDDAEIIQISLVKTFTWLAVGKPGSGRTNLIRVLAGVLQAMQIRVVLVDFTGKLADLRRADEDAGSKLQYIADDKALYDMLSQQLQPLIVRHRQLRDQLRGQGRPEREIFERMREDGGMCVLTPSLTELMQHLYHPDQASLQMHSFMQRILEKGEGLGFWLIGAAAPEEAAQLRTYGAAQHVLKRADGVWLGGGSAGQTIFPFEGLSYREQAKSMPAGMGCLPARAREEIRIVQIPLAQPETHNQYVSSFP